MTWLQLALANTKVYQRTAPRVSMPGVVFEVERKFSPTPASIARLKKNAGNPPFSSHKYLSRKVLKDVYFQAENVDLMDRGIYIRARNGVLEAKVRQGGDWTNSVSQEIVGEEEVKNFIASAFPDMPIRLDDLKPSSWMRTLRDEWKIDGFSVAVDRTLFGTWMWGKATYPQKPHMVAEVELCQRVRNEEREEAAREMDRRIEAFMKKHEWAFPRGGEKPRGKLVAYVEWMRECTRKRMEATEDRKMCL